MLIEQIIRELNVGQIYRRVGSGSKSRLKRGFRCQSGMRKGRIVADPATCNKPKDIKKMVRAKATRKRLAKRAAIKRGISMRRNPVSKRLRSLQPRT